MTEHILNDNELLIERYAYKKLSRKEKAITLTTKAAEITLKIYDGQIFNVRLNNRPISYLQNYDFADLGDNSGLSDDWFLCRGCEDDPAVIFSGCPVPSTNFENKGEKVDFQKGVKRGESFNKTSIANGKLIGWVDHNAACVLSFDFHGEIKKVAVYNKGSLYLTVNSQGRIEVIPDHRQDIKRAQPRREDPLVCFAKKCCSCK